VQVRGEVDELEEEFNEAGQAMEPFHLHREREEGFYDEVRTHGAGSLSVNNCTLPI
jgi:hypothetical protein